MSLQCVAPTRHKTRPTSELVAPANRILWRRVAARLATLGPLFATQMGMGAEFAGGAGAPPPWPVTAVLTALFVAVCRPIIWEDWGDGGRLALKALGRIGSATNEGTITPASSCKPPALPSLRSTGTRDPLDLVQEPLSPSTLFHLWRGRRALDAARSHRTADPATFAVNDPELAIALQHFDQALVGSRLHDSLWTAVVLETAAEAALNGGRYMPRPQHGTEWTAAVNHPIMALRIAAERYEAAARTTTDPYRQLACLARSAALWRRRAHLILTEHTPTFGRTLETTLDTLDACRWARTAAEQCVAAVRAIDERSDAGETSHDAAVAPNDRVRAQRALDSALAEENAVYTELARRARTEPDVATVVTELGRRTSHRPQLPIWAPWAILRFATAHTLANELAHSRQPHLHCERALQHQLNEYHRRLTVIRTRQQQREALRLTPPMQAALEQVVRSVLTITADWIAQSGRAITNPLESMDRLALAEAGFDHLFFEQTPEADAQELQQLETEAAAIGQQIEREEWRHRWAEVMLPPLLRATHALAEDGATLENVRAGLVAWLLDPANDWGATIFAELPQYAHLDPRLVWGVMGDVLVARPGWLTAALEAEWQELAQHHGAARRALTTTRSARGTSSSTDTTPASA